MPVDIYKSIWHIFIYFVIPPLMESRKNWIPVIGNDRKKFIFYLF